jgi:5'-nucleotidase
VGAVDQLSLPPRTLLNVNVPDLPWNEVKGVKVTRLGYRGPAEQPLAVKDPRGRTRYWIAPVSANADDGEDTDFAAVEAGYVSITPLQTDLTRHQALNDVRDWLDAFA